MIEQIFVSPQVKRSVIISNKLINFIKFYKLYTITAYCLFLLPNWKLCHFSSKQENKLFP